MPRKKKEEIEETQVETVEATEESAVESKAESSADNTDAAAKGSDDASENTEAGESSSLLGSVFETVSSVVGSVAEAVTSGVSTVVSAVSDLTTTDDADNKTQVRKRAEKIGVVSSDKMTKTVVVRVDRVVKHPVYRKYVKRRNKFMAHDEKGATIGDKVRIVETRPMSARKRWRVVEIIQKAEK